MVLCSGLGARACANLGEESGMIISEPIWITGLGTANPLGADVATVSRNLLEGKSGISLVNDIPNDFACKIAGRVGVVSLPPGWDEPAFRALDPLHQLVLWCTSQALIDAGLWQERENLRVGLVLGLGAEWMRY